MNLIINEKDPSDLKKNITKLQKIRKQVLRDLGYNPISFQGTKYNMESVYPEMLSILNTDISNLYKNLDNSKEYYVYAHCNPLVPLSVKYDLRHFLLASEFKLTCVPFYIGKGSKERAFELDRNEGHRKIRTIILNKDKDIEVVKLASNLNEGDALSLESKLIDILGLRIHGGMLVNLDEGCKPKERRNLYSTFGKKLIMKNGFDL